MIAGFASAQAAYDAAEPDNTDEEAWHVSDCNFCDGDCCGTCRYLAEEEDPDDARDREYAYGDED